MYSNKKKDVVININQLAKMTETTLDLGKLGYTKLLGTGKITHAVHVKVDSVSVRAKEKIEKAGGKVDSKTEGE